MKKFSVYLAAGFVLFAIGCSRPTNQDYAKLTGQNAVTPDFKSIYGVLKENCASCHRKSAITTSDGRELLLDFNSGLDNAHHDLLSRPTQNFPSESTCRNVKRVHPGDPRKSFLMGVIFADYNTNNFAGSPGCQPSTTHYSVRNLNLDPSEKQAIITWIKNGAGK